MQTNLSTNRVFVCISIIGCKDVYTYRDYYLNKATIDRDALLIEPCVFESFEESSVEICLDRLRLNFLLALGLTKNKDFEKLFAKFEQ